MIKPEQPRIEIDDLTAVIRESIAAQKHDDGPGFSNASATENTVQPSAPELKLQPDFQPRSNNRYHISDLLRYHDRAFVENAFRAIVKRPPDATEFARDLKRVRSGQFNKIDLLSTLRYSNEGKAKGVEIDGLTVPALVRQLGHLPIIGYFIRLVIALVRLPDQVRDQREFAGYVLAQNQQMADFINVISARVAEYSTAVSRVEERLSEQMRSEHEASERATIERLNHLNDHFAAEIEKQSALFDQLGPRIEARIQTEKDLLDQRIKLLDELSATLQIGIEREAVKRRQELDQLRSQQQQSAARHEHAITAAANELREEIERVHRQLQHARAELSLQSRNISSVVTPASDPAPAESHQLDALYAALEDRFRGTREEIKDRFKIYLPYVEPARDAEVVDLGCGRGEWLELLNESGFKGRGVERNLVQIDACRQRGLDVVDDDMIAYLRTLPDESTGAVTGFHVIEHVSIDALVSLFNEVLRVLRPGGVAIFETPNPENVLVGSNFFYLDPTHHHPLPSELTQFLFESRGFDRIEVLYLHPWDAGRVAGHGELTERFNGYFFGPMDYAIVGHKVQT